MPRSPASPRAARRAAAPQSIHDVVRTAPATVPQLHGWLVSALGIHVPWEPIEPGSDPPLAYLVHTFFEGTIALDGRPIGPGAPGGDCVVWACRAGGKTFLGAAATVLDLVFKPGIQVRILGGSMEQSRRMLRHLRRFFERPGLRELVDGRHGLTDGRVRLRSGSGAEVLAASQTSVRGTRVQKLRCDEVDLFDREVWEAAQLTTRSLVVPGPWGREVRGSVEALSTMHRPMGLMWEVVQESTQRTAHSTHEGTASGSRVCCDAVCCELSPPRRRLFRWGVVDVLGVCGQQHRCESCELWNDCRGRAKARDGAAVAAGQAPETVAGHVGVRDAIAMKRRVGLEVWESEMLCHRARRSDAVYPEFDPAVHLAASDERAEGSALVCGMDFGFRAPTVVLWAIASADGVLRVVDERVEAGSRLEEHIRAITASRHGPAAWIGVDPAGAQRSDQTGRSNIETMRAEGLVVRWRRTTLHEGLALVRARLRPATGPARLFIHPRCTRLIESLQRYRYPEKRPESLVPLKDGFDHAPDALRYLVANLDRPYRVEEGRYV